jgi:hypothetical protein
MSGSAARISVPKDFTSHGRLKSPCASIMSGPYAAHSTPPPLRYASISCGSTLAHATITRANGAIEDGLSLSRSGAMYACGSTKRRSSGSAMGFSTSRIPVAACCSSHSRA